MATFITLVTFTDQGIRHVKESPDRLRAFETLGETLGVKIKAVYYTVGEYDMVVVSEGTDDAAMALLLKTSALGNVRTRTLRAFSVDEMKKIIGKMG